MTEKAELSDRLALNIDIAKAHGWYVEERPTGFYMHGPNHFEFWTCSLNEHDAWVECIDDGSVPDWIRDLNLAWALLMEMHNLYGVVMHNNQIQYWQRNRCGYILIAPLTAEGTAYAICRVWKIINGD